MSNTSKEATTGDTSKTGERLSNYTELPRMIAGRR